MPVTRSRFLRTRFIWLVFAALILPTVTQPQAEGSPKALSLNVGVAPAVPRAPEPLVAMPKQPEPPNYLSIKKASDERLAAEEKARQEAEAKRVCEEQGGHLEGADCVPPPPPPPPPPPEPVVAYTASTQVTVTYGDFLTGSYGYALAGGNCVVEPGVNNPGWGNPIDWPITSTEPWIGASALFGFNHVAVVTGLWSNGDIEVRHQNCSGCPTRYPRSSFRGVR
jgi:hypothetical protein